MNFLKKSVLLLTLSFLLGSHLSGHIGQQPPIHKTQEQHNASWRRAHQPKKRPVEETLKDIWMDPRETFLYFAYELSHGENKYKVVLNKITQEEGRIPRNAGVYDSGETTYYVVKEAEFYYETEADFRHFKELTSNP